MIEAMSKIEIIGPKKHFDEILEYLHNAGVLQIEDVEESIAGQYIRRMTAGDYEQKILRNCENLLMHLNTIYSHLHPRGLRSTFEHKHLELYMEMIALPIEEAMADSQGLIDEVQPRVSKLIKQRSELEGELSYLSQYQAIFMKIEPLVSHLVFLENLETVALLIQKKNIGILQTLEDELDIIANTQYEMIATEVDEDTVAALIIYKKKFAREIGEVLWGESVVKIKLPKEYQSLDFKAAIKEIRGKIEAIPKTIADIDKELDDLGDEYCVKVKAAIDLISDKVHQLESIGHFGQTRYAFIIRGWVPTGSIPIIKKQLDEKFMERIYLEALPLTFAQHQLAPVSLKNVTIAKPFEMLVRLLNIPKYGTVDPTPYIAFFFPLFFGMILGDVGYGIIVGILGYVLQRKYSEEKDYRDVSKIFYLCSATSIIFGLLFAEFFGNLPERFHMVREFEILGAEFPLDRADPQLLFFFMIFSVAIGFIHISLGLVLGIVNAVKMKTPKHAYEKAGILAFLLSVLLIALVSAKLLPAIVSLAAYVIIFGGLGLIVYGAGFIGLIEVTGIITHVLSYARLFAIGLASVYLAIIVNQATFGIDNVFLAILVGVFFHTINLVLGIFSPALHSMRLLFVEFFTKFYESGGKEYKPFQRIGGEGLWK